MWQPAQSGPELGFVGCALAECRFGAREEIPVGQKEGEQEHLDPEHRRAREGLDIGGEQQEPATQGDHEADEHGPMNGVQVRQVANLA